MKPRKSNRSSSDNICYNVVIAQYITVISEKMRPTGNRFNVRTVFELNIHFVEQ
jgi:hypothetical protein